MMLVRARRTRVGSSGSSPVAPSFSVAPAIVGTPTVGVATSYTPGTVSGSPTPTITQQWTLDGVDISGATGATYTPVTGDATHLLRVREIATNASGNANSTSASATIAGIPAGGTFVQLGTQTLSQYATVVRTALPEGLTSANNRMLPSSGLTAFCGATIWRDKYALPIGGGHGDSYDDGGYAQNLATGAWETIVVPSTFGSSTDTIDANGEYVGNANRPASQHSYWHNVTLGNHVVQGFGYAVGHVAGGSPQAHRWNGVTNAWERFGTGGLTSGRGFANFVHFDYIRNRIVRHPIVANQVPEVVANDPTAAWSSITPAAWPAADIYGSIGYHEGLDCYVWIDQHEVATRQHVYVMDAANIAGGWSSVSSVLGLTMPNPMVALGLEYIPPLGCFAAMNGSEPDKLYYLTPTGPTRTDPWTWTSESFTGTTTPAGFNTDSAVYGRAKWSHLLNALVILKHPGALTEVWTPTGVSQATAAADWTARAAESGVVVAYDFASAPANGGTVRWGSLKNTPHITCYQQNDSVYGTYVNVDNAIYPPGGSASLRWDVPDCPTSGIAERGDLWWISIDDYADQFGDNAEFWVQWRTRMDSTYATFPFADHGSGSGGTDIPPLGLTAYKQLMCGEGMQTGELGMDPAWPYGYRGAGTSLIQNQIAGIRVDFEGETNMIGSVGSDGATTSSVVFKYPTSYHGKPGYVGLNTSGTDGSFFTGHNSGNESAHYAACQYQLDGLGIKDRSSCFIYPTNEWFTLMMHVKLGVRGHGISSMGQGYQNVGATFISTTQISLPADVYTEHFNPAISGGMYIRIRGTLTGSVDALVTVKDTSSGHAVLTFSGATGTVHNEALQVDEYENGFVNSTLEYYGAYQGGAMQLLHKRTGVVMRNGNYVNDSTGYTPTAKYGTFAWTTFMTNKSYQQTHPVAKVWVSQIVIKSGATAPSTPRY